MNSFKQSNVSSIFYLREKLQVVLEGEFLVEAKKAPLSLVEMPTVFRMAVLAGRSQASPHGPDPTLLGICRARTKHEASLAGRLSSLPTSASLPVLWC